MFRFFSPPHIIIIKASSSRMHSHSTRMGSGLNPFENYSEFLADGDNPKRKGDAQYVQDAFLNDLSTISHDIDFILKKKFYKADYPADIANANIFCPLCGKVVLSMQLFVMYDSENYKRKFLAHDSCLMQETSRILNDVFDHVEEMVLCAPDRNPKMKAFSIGDREFCLELSICHPLSDLKFIKLISKGHLNGSCIRWELKQEDQPFCYQPNLICFPFIDFKISLTISEIGSQQAKRIITHYVNLSRFRFAAVKEINAKSEQINLEMRIHSTPKEKEDIIEEMNYKYQYSEKLTLPIVELAALEVEIPEEEYNEELESNTNSTIVELLSEKVGQSSYASSINHYANNYNYFDQVHSNNGSMQANTVYSQQPQLAQSKPSEKSICAEKEKVDLEKLISTNKLSSYVRNGAQSRIFQNFLDEATNEQVDMIIKALYQEFPDLVTDEYANYMAQKLFQVCLPAQRLSILSKLFPQIPSLVRNKQGTHTIQAFISLLTLNEQFSLICDSIRQQFEELCFHSISTHFVQKIIKVFPLERTMEFYEMANASFLRFATDKNAMCVLKYMLRRIKQYENHPGSSEIKKHFINSITFNTDKIIQDCYGNYVVQFCYELFGEAKSSGITEMIIEKFVQFSLQKYSSSVVAKCIGSYWADRSYANRLKDSLKNEGIIEMYRNKEGNKILLDLMDRNENTPLREKIYNLIANTGEQSKFYHDRWGMQIGIRSGPVGIEFKSFAEADRAHNTTGKKNKKR